MTEPDPGALEQARRDLGLSFAELWQRYFELGGMSTALELEGFLARLLRPTNHDHDLIAHALNERFVELGGKPPVAYLDDDLEGPTHERDP
jgi:hypothetical protein